MDPYYKDLLWLVGIGALLSVAVLGGYVVWMARDDERSEPDGNMSFPTCYGDYPKYSSQKMAERECWTCLYKPQCRERKESV